MSEKTAPVTFHAPEALKKYIPDFGPFTLKLPEGIQLPYNSLTIARKIGNEEPESLLVTDKLHPCAFENSIASRIINDPDCQVHTRPVSILKDNNLVDGVAYELKLTNPDCVLFHPTVHKPITNAINVSSKLDIELVLSFDDGYVLPMIHHYETEGMFSPDFRDLVRTLLDDFSPCEPETWFTAVLSNCPNAQRVDRGDGSATWLLTACNLETGVVTDLEFEENRMSISELASAISSIRMVRLDETIHSKSL